MLHRPSFEVHVLGGMGTVMTRPVSLVDSADRHFDFQYRLGMSVGAALRVRLTNGLLLSLEGRDVILVDQHENFEVAPSDGYRSREDPSTWGSADR